MSASTVIGIVTVIVMVFGGFFSVIGWLLDKGINALTAEVKGLREDLKSHTDKEAIMESAQAAHKAACEERHKRLDYEITDLRNEVKER